MASIFFLYIRFPYYSWSKPIDYVNVRNGFRYFFISCLWLAGQSPRFRTLLLRWSRCICSSVHWLIKWSVVWSPFLQTHVAWSSILNLWRKALVFPCPVTSAVKSGVMSIHSFCLSVTFGKNCFVAAAFLQSSHSFGHFSVASSSISLWSVLNGIVLHAIVLSLLRASSFASRSASSFPYIPTWALTQENSTVQFALSKVDIFFLDSSNK